MNDQTNGNIEARFPHCLAFEVTGDVTFTFEGKEFAKATLRQLSYGDILESGQKSFREMLWKGIKSWDFKDKAGKDLEITEENVRALSVEIAQPLLEVFLKLNFVTKAEAENLSRP